MQPLNDDMDDLFRRAADEYPLNTGDADWNKVLQGLHHVESDFDKEDRKKKDYKFLWLLLLLPIGFICGRYIGYDKKPTDIKAEKEVKTTSAGAYKTTVIAKGGEKRIAGENDQKEAPASETNAANTSDNHSIIQSLARNADKSAISNGTNNAITGLTSQQGKVFLPRGKVADERGIKNDRETDLLTNKLIKQSDGIQPAQDLSANKSSSASPDKSALDLKPTPLQTGTSTSADSSIKSSNNSNQVTNLTNSKETKNKNQNTFKRGFSYSLLIGPDVSAVKSKKTSDVGYSLGLTLGYRFAKRVSIGVGLLWDRKNYYSEGKYLDTNRLKLPMWSIVKNATGYCDMIEIPINVTYDFISKQNHSWFVSGGLSSYLMQNEDYSISYQRYNQLYVKDYGYMNSTKDWFSIMNLSVGYQKAVGKRTNINIAPYVKLPLRGIGIGKIPVSSTGVYLSLSRSFK